MRCAARACALRAHCPRLAQALRRQWRWASVSRVTHGAPAALPLTVAGGWALLALEEGTAVLSPAGGERDRETVREGPSPVPGLPGDSSHLAYLWIPGVAQMAPAL